MTRFVYAFLVVLFIGMLPVAGSAATVTPAIPYQGKLTDPGGNPLTGTYGMIFTLYDVPSGGVALSTDTHSVTATNGLFTTTITVTDPAILDGRALWLGVRVGTDAEMTPRQSLQPVPYAFGLRPGVVGASFTTGEAGMSASNTNAGVNVSTHYNYNPGVQINTFNDISSGVISSTHGYNSRGVDVYTFGSNSHGVVAQTIGLNSKAIYGSSVQDIGVYGEGRIGGFFTTNGGGTCAADAKVGVNVTTRYDYNPGVSVKTDGFNSGGVYVQTNNSESYGVVAFTNGSSSRGMFVDTSGPYSDGIFAWTHSYNSHGVVAITNGPNSYGVFANSNQSNGIYTETNRADDKYGLYTPDYIWAKGTQYPTADVAEYMPVTDAVSPGTVLIIGEDGRLTPASTAYDTRVAGIVSTEPGVFLGTKEDGNEGEALIAVAGRVPCKVDATYGAIRPGDLLTTSSTPGHAMKAQDPKIGTVLGKAMGSLESGTGAIEVLVTLQ